MQFVIQKMLRPNSLKTTFQPFVSNLMFL